MNSNLLLCSNIDFFPFKNKEIKKDLFFPSKTIISEKANCLNKIIILIRTNSFLKNLISFLRGKILSIN